jgi:Spy/CpxP family protein refolding chaperone
VRRSAVWLLLALSVLFNVFFAAGFLRARAVLERSGASNGVSRQVAAELQLDDTQRRIFSDLRTGLSEELSVYRQSIEQADQKLLEELSRERPDLEQVRAIMESRADLERQQRMASLQRFSEFLGVLSPEQCGKLSSRARRGHRGHRGRGIPPKVLKQFDADGDGALNEQERAAAQEHWQKERHRRRKEMLERFDEDGDGRLSREERAALRQWMEQHGGEHRPPRPPKP